MSICVWVHVLFFCFFFLLLFCPFDSDTLPSWRLHLQTLLAQFHVCNLKKTRRRKKNKMTQKQPPRWPRWVWMDFFLLCLVQGLRCLLENQHSSGILGKCTAMWLPDPNERCKPPSLLCVSVWVCVRECVSPIDAKYASTDIWACGGRFYSRGMFLLSVLFIMGIKGFCFGSRSLVQCTCRSAHLFLFFFKKSLGTADGGPPSGRGQECF